VYLGERSFIRPVLILDSPTPFRPSTPACSVNEPPSIAEEASHPFEGDVWVYRSYVWFVCRQWKIVESLELQSDIYIYIYIYIGRAISYVQTVIAFHNVSVFVINKKCIMN